MRIPLDNWYVQIDVHEGNGFVLYFDYNCSEFVFCSALFTILITIGLNLYSAAYLLILKQGSL